MVIQEPQRVKPEYRNYQRGLSDLDRAEKVTESLILAFSGLNCEK